MDDITPLVRLITFKSNNVTDEIVCTIIIDDKDSTVKTVTLHKDGNYKFIITSKDVLCNSTVMHNTISGRLIELQADCTTPIITLDTSTKYHGEKYTFGICNILYVEEVLV